MVTQETKLAAFVREQAHARDMSYNQLAVFLGVSAATLSQIRRGHTPTLETLQQMAEKLDMQPNDLAELAGLLKQNVPEKDLPPEVRGIIRRYSKLPPDRQEALLRMWDQMISFAEVQSEAE